MQDELFQSAVLVSDKPEYLWYLSDIHTLDVLPMNRFGSLAVLLTLAGVSGTTSASEKKPMLLSEVVSGAVQLVPGPPGKFEDFLQAPAREGGVSSEGRRTNIDYQTRDGVLLHIELYSDRRNASEPSVTRMVLGVDESHCVVSDKLKADLDSKRPLVWTSLGNDAGWLSRVDGLFVSINKREGHCLAAVIADVMKIRAVPPTIHRLREPSGIVRKTPPDH